MSWEDYEERCEKVSRLESAFHKLSQKDQITLLTKLWACRDAAEEALLEYFSQVVIDDDIDASSQRKALVELRALAKILEKEK